MSDDLPPPRDDLPPRSRAGLKALLDHLDRPNRGSHRTDAAGRLSAAETRETLAPARALAESPYLRRLRSLLLHGCDIGDEGARALARSPVLATLEDLDLSYNDITGEGARALAATPYLGRLRPGGLDMGGSKRLTADGVQALRARFGDGVRTPQPE